jgi:hypothetical protein
MEPTNGTNRRVNGGFVEDANAVLPAYAVSNATK